MHIVAAPVLVATLSGLPGVISSVAGHFASFFHFVANTLSGLPGVVRVIIPNTLSGLPG